MQQYIHHIPSLHQLTQLPGFAAYLLQNRLQQYVQVQLQYSRALNVPLLKLFEQTPEEEATALAQQHAGELLSYLEKNKAEEHIRLSMEKWSRNLFPYIDKHQVRCEDISLMVYIRKQTLLHFAEEYCSNLKQAMELIREIDLFCTRTEEAAITVFTDLLREQIEEQAHLTKNIANTSPGIIYLLHLPSQSVLFANKTAEAFFGFTAEEFIAMGSQVLQTLIHPDDLPAAFQFLTDMNTVQDGEVRTLEFRMRSKDGSYIWMRNYSSVFKRDADAVPTEIIGNILNIQFEKEYASRLQASEERYRQAEGLTHIGHYEWDLETNTIIWSDELYRIYGLEPQANPITYEEVARYTHPGDLKSLQQAIAASRQTHQPFDFYYRIHTAGNKEKILHARGNVLTNAENKVIKIIGTVQDETEKQILISRLEQSDTLYKQAEALAHIGNWYWNLEDDSIMFTDELYRIYGMEPQTVPLTFQQIKPLFHPDDAPRIEATLSEAIREKQPFSLHHRVVLNKAEKIVEVRGRVITDAEGKAIRLEGTTQDITEQYRIQQELKDNQTFIRKIADATPSIIASYNVNTGQYVFISEGIKKLLGYNPEEAMREGVQFFINIVHPDDLPKLQQKNAEALEEANNNPDKNDLVVEFTYRMRHRNGSYRWFHTYGTIFDRNSSGKIEHVLNISLDITEQKEASRKIEEQEQFIQNIADASPTILYVYDVPSASFAYVNHEIYFVLGYTPEEVLDMGSAATENLYHPDDFHLLPERQQSSRRIVESDIMIQYECRMKARSGEWQWFLVREVVFRTNEKGKPLQIVGAALDITKRKEMERTLLQNSFMLEQSNASLEEFAYVASHDLKEPLRKISTFGDRLMTTQADRLTEEGKLYLNKIVDASQRMQTMISDLLSISMISGNKAFEPYSLQKVLEETLQTLEYKIDQKNALIESDGLPKANIVPSQFRQLFQNLLSNSLKFIQPGVQPRISIRHQYLSPQEVNSYQLSAAERYLKIEFTDNGIGFENEFAGKIFLIFQRLHGRSEYEGSGIGLAICKKIVEHHGGIIYASGEPDKGATFTIILPA